MQTKRKFYENEVLKCIENKTNVQLSNITSHLFSLEPISDFPNTKVMEIKWHAKEHHAKKLIESLIYQNKIRIDNYELKTYKIVKPAWQ